MTVADFINTIDALGDAVVMDSIINRTITEFKDDSIETVGDYAFSGCAAMTTLELPNVASTGRGFMDGTNVTHMKLPRVTEIPAWYIGAYRLQILDLPVVTSIAKNGLVNLQAIKAIILRNTSAVCELGGELDYYTMKAYFYVPAALLTEYQAATNWSTYAAQFRALEDYTVDGTIDGELDETKI